MKTRNSTAIISCLVLLGTMVLLMSHSPVMATEAIKDSKAKEDPMSLAYKTEPMVIPSIDAESPAFFETAAFGLG